MAYHHVIIFNLYNVYKYDMMSIVYADGKINYDRDVNSSGIDEKNNI